MRGCKITRRDAAVQPCTSRGVRPGDNASIRPYEQRIQPLSRGAQAGHGDAPAEDDSAHRVNRGYQPRVERLIAKGSYDGLGSGQVSGVRRDSAKAASVARSRAPARLYLCDPILERLAQDPKDMAAALGPCIQEAHAMVGPATRHPASARGPRRSAPHPRWCGGARNGRVVTHAVRAPVGPATLWMRVVFMASARVMDGRMVVSRRASMDLPAPGGPSRSRLWAERLHSISLHPCLAGCRWTR
jgi:hypothetical protein